jgi:hypothetical protein
MTRLLVIAALAIATSAAAQENDNCRFEAERAANIDARSSDQLLLIARGGSLRVEGRAGLDQVRVRGRACASSEDLLDQLKLETSRNGGTVRVEVPEIDNDDWMHGRNTYALLHLVIEVPEGMAADITDGSGEATLSGLGQLRVDDGSGELTIQDIAGSVEIDDGSGGIVAHGIHGDITVEDGSGNIDLRDITGSVEIDDGSGGMDVAEVGGSVRVEDGSGDIHVANVQGDFTVVDDGSGSIRHSGVHGRVRIPEKDRNGRRR